jgi:predicted RNase H-like HicB family nuclease
MLDFSGDMAMLPMLFISCVLMTYTAYITQGELMYVATCLENGVVSQGETPQVALKNLQEAVYAYVLETAWEALSTQEESVSFISPFTLPQYA